jgi:hypothetical protein
VTCDELIAPPRSTERKKIALDIATMCRYVCYETSLLFKQDSRFHSYASGVELGLAAFIIVSITEHFVLSIAVHAQRCM